jgi:diguanylate cyclase (GGDEF)-like protein
VATRVDPAIDRPDDEPELDSQDDLTQKVEVRHLEEHRKRAADCLVLIHTDGPDLGKRYDLHGSSIIIGRDPASDIFVDEDTASRRHARVEKTSEQTLLVDLGSTNGTYLNDNRIPPDMPVRLAEGDRVKIGRSIFKYLAGNVIETLYYEEIHKMAIMDGLTGLYNKRYFMETLEREISRARRHKRSLSLILFDIDHFKEVNDGFGHLAGDHILKELSEIIKSRVRREEVVARYGGEELVVLMPETHIDGAYQLAEQIRNRVQAHDFLFSNKRIGITISGGVAESQEADYEMMDFIQLADDRLYEAKNSGRNMVIGRD